MFLETKNKDYYVHLQTYQKKGTITGDHTSSPSLSLSRGTSFIILLFNFLLFVSEHYLVYHDFDYCTTLHYTYCYYCLCLRVCVHDLYKSKRNFIRLNRLFHLMFLCLLVFWSVTASFIRKVVITFVIFSRPSFSYVFGRGSCTTSNYNQHFGFPTCTNPCIC